MFKLTMTVLLSFIRSLDSA